MNKKTPRLFLITAIMLIGLIVIQFIFSNRDGATELNIDQLIAKIEKQQITDVNISPENGAYILRAREVSTEDGEKIKKQREEKIKKDEALAAKQAELDKLQKGETNLSDQEKQQRIKQLKEELGQNNNLVKFPSFNLLGRQRNDIVGKPVRTNLLYQEYQIKEVTDKLDEKGIAYSTQPYSAPFDIGIIFQIGMFAILGFFVFNMIRGKTPGIESKDFTPKVPKTRFSDVIGYEEEKQELSELVDFLKNPKKYQAMGAKLPSGVLLEGPPGTGKTLMAKAVAGESNVPFFAVSGSDFEEMYVGLGASRIRKLFKEARKHAPAIIFIDEIDAVGRRDVSKNSNPAQNQTINSLLVEMDGFESDESSLIVMAATNRKDNLDDALLRPGRFDRQVLVDLPPVKTREDILKFHLRDKNIVSNIDFKSLARSTTGMSGAQLSAVANEGAILAVRDRKQQIDQIMLQEAIDRVLMGPAKITNKYSDTDKRVVSFHEAGHCIVGLTLEGALEVQKITIIPRRDAGGYVSYIPTEEEERFITKKQLEDRLASLMAGRVSEELFNHDITIGAYNDFEQATNIARAMVTKYGMDKELGVNQYEVNGTENPYANKQYSDATAQRIDMAINSLLNTARETARKILIERKDDVILLATTIAKREVLDKEQIDFLMKHRYLPEDESIIYKQSDEPMVGANPQSSVEQNRPEPTVDKNPQMSPTWPRKESGNTDADNFM